MAEQSQIGLSGLAVMGANLARNLARNGFRVAVHNRTGERTERFMAEFGHEGHFTPAHSLHELAAAIARPRTILVMVKAGKPVDDVIAELEPFLEQGDIVIDGGNSLFSDTQRRAREIEAKGLRFLGTGVSGGEEGALHGPSIMPGGTREAYDHVEPILTKISAQVDGTPCCTYIGADGAGHYVKMVHNGIEYADMQLIAEAYDLLSQVAGLSAPAIAGIFSRWNAGDLDSYLIEISAEVLRKLDVATGRPLVDMILDMAEQKGTGRWTVQSALELGVPITAIGEAVFARILSSQAPERTQAAKILPGPASVQPIGGQEDSFVEAVHQALYASKIVAYAQGFAQMHAASVQYGWNLKPGEIATIWRGGCIIRAKFLDRIKEAYDRDPELKNLLLTPYFGAAVEASQRAWRRVVCQAVESGVPVPTFATSLAYFDGYRRERGPANLIQGLRDYFGAHTYRRIDRPGSFHTLWSGDGSEVEG
jgi:6-phosphogluconate dehydrogenase